MCKKNKNTFQAELVLFFVVVCFSVFSVGCYFSIFNNGLSDQPSDWGNFGSYVNGVLNPVFLFLTIIYLARSLKQQRESNKETNELKQTLNHQSNMFKVTKMTADYHLNYCKTFQDEIDQLQQKKERLGGDQSSLIKNRREGWQIHWASGQRHNQLAEQLLIRNFKSIEEINVFYRTSKLKIKKAGKNGEEIDWEARKNSNKSWPK